VATTGNTACSALSLTYTDPGVETPGAVTIDGFSSGKFYSAADTIDILVPTAKAYTTLKVRVFAVGVQFS